MVISLIFSNLEVIFDTWLYDNRLNGSTRSDREECGKYLWWLWETGATLEGIHWYVEERDVDGDQSTAILNQIKGIYPNLYARKQSEDAIIQGLPVRYGFHTNVATNPMIISTLIKVIREGMYVERDKRCIDEFLNYDKKPNGSFGARQGTHDDLLMTRAIGLHICFYEMKLPQVVTRGSNNLKYVPKVVSAASF